MSLADALENPDYLTRMHGVAKTLEGMSPENIDENLAIFEKSHSSWSDTEVRAFMTAWSRFDPEAAFAWANGWSGFTRDKFRRIALWAWASVDPQRALKAFESIPAGRREQQEYRLELVKGWTRGGDAEGATEYVLSFGGGRSNSRLINKMASWIAASGIDAVIEWAESIPEDEEDNWAKEAAFQAAIAAVAKVDTSRAAAWYEANRDDEFAAPALKMLAFSWQSNGDPVTLFEWLVEQPENQLLVETVRQTYRQWLKRDQEGAIAWIRHVALKPVHDPALAVFARLESRIAPASAVEWAERIHDQQMQRMTIVPILRLWAKEDYEAAHAWMVEHDYPTTIQHEVIGRLARQAEASEDETEDEPVETPPATATPESL